jgi:CHAT domain-containing protein
VKLSDHLFDSTIQILKSRNDAEGFTYAFVDQYLARPDEVSLRLFDRYHKELWRPLVTAEENLACVILFCNNGYYLTRYGEIYKAIEAYEKAWKIFDNAHLIDFDITEYCLKPLANNYSMLGDYSSAGNIVKHYLFLAEKEKNNEQILSGLINLAIVYHDTGKPSEAISLLQQALEIKNRNTEKTGLVYAGLAGNYERVGDLVKARRYAEMAIATFKNNRSENTPVQLVSVYKTLAVLSMQEHRIDDALQSVQDAQRIAASNKKNFQSRDLAKLNNSYAEILHIKKLYRDALKSYQNTLAILLPNYNSSRDTLPEASSLYAENTIKETLDGMADVYLKLNQPKLALTCYELSFTTEELLRIVYNYDDAKLQQQLENRRRTEGALTILYDLAIRSKDNEFAIRAFQFAERTKAITLRESFNSRYVRRNISTDSLIKQERVLRYKQAKINNAIALEQMKHEQADIRYINQLLADQNKIVLLLKGTENAVRQKYPEASRNDFKPVDILSIQNKLTKDNAVLIEYFVGEESMFAFVITSTSIAFKKIDNPSAVKKDIIVLSDLFSDASAINNKVYQYKDVAFRLYTALELPNQNGQKKLIVIPDGLLALIPFDALLYEKSEGTQYATFPYLVRKYTIAYQTSAFIYSSYGSMPRSADKERLLGMFPVFDKTNQVLSYSVQEAEGIQSYINGKYLYKQEATMKAFVDNGNKYSIIHLSTHADAGNAQQPPSIAFIDSTLYLPQIYGLQFDTDLLVLSACETGAGMVVKGEGAMSLARGFQFAGVHNIIFSLWQVNDYSTAALMENFYENYSDTGLKADALCLAKLAYLNDDNIRNNHKSPYYWASFVYYGDIENQITDKVWSMMEMIFVATAFAAILFILYCLKSRYVRQSR